MKFDKKNSEYFKLCDLTKKTKEQNNILQRKKISTMKVIEKKIKRKRVKRRKRLNEISTARMNFFLFSNFVKLDWSLKFIVKSIKLCQKHYNELTVWVYNKTDKFYKHRKKRHVYKRRLCFHDLLDWLSMIIICWKIESC